MDKFCKDCKWARVSFVNRLIGGYRFAMCGHPTQVEKDKGYLVTGHSKQVPELYCATQRDSKVEGRCGKEGRLWEAKEGAAR